MRFFVAAAALAAIAWGGLSGCGSKEKENLARRIVYHPGNSKSIKLEWTIKKLANGDTLLHGVMKEFYWGGADKKAVVYKDGKRDGTAQAWYDNGKQQWMKTYEKGRKASTWRLFYSDGGSWIVLNHDKEGNIDGTVRKWDRGADPEKPVEAVFTKGTCTSGDCRLLDPPEMTPDTPPQNKTQVERDREILADFLD